MPTVCRSAQNAAAVATYQVGSPQAHVRGEMVELIGHVALGLPGAERPERAVVLRNWCSLRNPRLRHVRELVVGCLQTRCARAECRQFGTFPRHILLLVLFYAVAKNTPFKIAGQQIEFTAMCVIVGDYA